MLMLRVQCHALWLVFVIMPNVYVMYLCQKETAIAEITYNQTTGFVGYIFRYFVCCLISLISGQDFYLPKALTRSSSITDNSCNVSYHYCSVYAAFRTNSLLFWFHLCYQSSFIFALKLLYPSNIFSVSILGHMPWSILNL